MKNKFYSVRDTTKQKLKEVDAYFNTTSYPEQVVVVKDNRKIRIVCNKDGSEKYINLADYLKFKYCCDTCVFDKYTENLKSRSFKYVNHIGKLYEIECLLCCTRKTITQSWLYSDSNIDCETCRVNRYKNALQLKNCVYISNKKCPQGRIVTYSDVNGKIRELHSSSVLVGQFSPTDYDPYLQKHSVYCIKLVTTDGVFVKIGTANNIHNRAAILKLVGEYTVFLIKEFDDRYQATKLESLLHHKFKHLSLSKAKAEEFTLGTVKRKDRSGERANKKDGVTEWFEESVFTILIQEGYLNVVDPHTTMQN